MVEKPLKNPCGSFLARGSFLLISVIGAKIAGAPPKFPQTTSKICIRLLSIATSRGKIESNSGQNQVKRAKIGSGQVVKHRVGVHTVHLKTISYILKTSNVHNDHTSWITLH